jgi:hypothetical protein
MQRRLVPTFCAAAALAAITGPPAHGELITGYEVHGEPTVSSFFTSVEYAADLDSLSVLGFIFDLDGIGDDDHAVSVGRLIIDARIDGGGAPDGGSLTVTGSVPGIGVAGPVLLTGDLREFGWGTVAPDLGPFQLIFTLTGGDLASTFGGVGTDVGVSLNQGLGFNGNWDSPFTGSGTTIGQLGVLLAPDGARAECDCLGDVNCDGIVDMDDVVMLIMDWGECGPGCAGDVTGNSLVDVEDLVEVVLHWGTCTTT